MSVPASETRSADRRALLPVGGAFVVFGMFWGSWAVATANVRSTYHLSNAQLGTLLAVAVTVSGVVGAVVGNRAQRWGAVRTLAWSILAWSALLMVTGATRTRPEFMAAFVVTMAAGGCVDMTMNAASAARLGHRPGDLVRFHGIFNVGALAGALLLGLVVQAGASWRWAWPAIGLAALPIAAWVRIRGSDPRGLGGDGPGGDEPDHRGHLSFARSLAQIRADGLLVLLVVFMVAEVVEGGVDTWGVLYLRTHLAITALVGASAYGLGQVVAIATRGAGGPGLGRLGPRWGVVVGAGAACGGLALEAFAGAPLAAGLGLALAAGGASIFWPLLMAHVSTVASRQTATVSAFTAAGYLGWVAGAPVIGVAADRFGLGAGLGIVAVLAGLVAATMLARGSG